MCQKVGATLQEWVDSVDEVLGKRTAHWHTTLEELQEIVEAADRRHSLRAERDEIDRMHRLVGLELRQHRIELEKLELTSQPTESVQETILRMEQQQSDLQERITTTYRVLSHFPELSLP